MPASPGPSYMNISPKHGVSLFETLVVLGILSVLLAISLPYLGQARESARSLQCLNQLKQQGLGMQFLVGKDNSWRERLDDLLLNCPSASVNQIEQNRNGQDLPTSTYMVVASGTATRESQITPNHPDAAKHRNGFSSCSDSRFVFDGLSNTVSAGDAVFDLSVKSPDSDDVCDRFQFGGLYTEFSWTYGSTGVPLNAIRRNEVPFEQREIAFGSHHVGGANMLFLDGHVSFVSEGISAATWSALGTIDNGDIVDGY